MKCRKAYAIIPVGENDRSAHVAQQKAPEVATPGLFAVPFWVGGLIPRLATSYSSPSNHLQM